MTDKYTVKPGVKAEYLDELMNGLHDLDNIDFDKIGLPGQVAIITLTMHFFDAVRKIASAYPESFKTPPANVPRADA